MITDAERIRELGKALDAVIKERDDYRQRNEKLQNDLEDALEIVHGENRIAELNAKGKEARERKQLFVPYPILTLKEWSEQLERRNEKLLAACKAVRYGAVCEGAGTYEDPFTYFWQKVWNLLKKQLDEAIGDSPSTERG